MVRDSLIRRCRRARAHAWDGAAFGLFAVLVVSGIDPILSGAGKFVDSLVPATSAEASDEPGRAGAGVARLPMFEFAGASHYAPQILFPVTSHSFPDWLRARIGLGPRHPVIAVCIDDLGEDLAGTDKAMALPKEIALSFLPYADGTPFLAQEAEHRGHDVLAHVPMQAVSSTDPGAMALNVGGPDLESRLAWNIARVPGLVGINNHEGSKLTGDEGSLIPVAQALAAKHLFFFDSRTTPDSKVVSVARSFGVLSAGRDIFLDDTLSDAAINAQLDALAATAKREGVAIAIGHPHDITLMLLAAWLAQNHGVTLVTLPEAMKRKSEDVALASR